MAKRLDPQDVTFPHGHTPEQIDDEELARRVAEAASGKAGESPSEDEMQRGDKPDLTTEEPVEVPRPEDENAKAQEEADEWVDSGAGVTVSEPPKTEIRKQTRYVVLEAVEVSISGEAVEMWRSVGEFDGPHPRDGAHAALTADLRAEHGALVAVPLRSWVPKRPVEKPRPPVVGWE